MKISQTLERTRTEGQVYPPGYYGYTYTDYMRDIKVYHLLPLNFIVRSLLIVRRSYQHMRLIPWDMEMNLLKRIARTAGYDAGFKDGFNNGFTIGLSTGKKSVMEAAAELVARSQKILDGKEEKTEGKQTE